MNGSFSVGYISSEISENYQWFYVLREQARYQVRELLSTSKLSERCALIIIRKSDYFDAFSIKPGDTLANDRLENVLYDLTGKQNRRTS